MAAVTHMTCIMSISAAVALSSHKGDMGTMIAAIRPPSRPQQRAK
jgi:hypothetical protein